MSDFIIIDGDEAIFMPNFGAAVVMIQPGTIEGSGPATFGGKPLCIEGDETSVEVSGCSYTTPQYTIPGVGTLKIDSLAGDQVAKKTKTGGTPVILKGKKFTAVFEVQTPAQQPPPGPGSPTPDSTKKYSGKGQFFTTNTKYKGT